MSQDIVRIMRIVIYEGPRDLVEEQVKYSIHGVRKDFRDSRITISAHTITEFPEIIKFHEAVANSEVNNESRNRNCGS